MGLKMMKTYQGSCHCGEVRFEVDAGIDHVRVCDCSICHKRGGLLFRVAKDAVRLLTPWEGLSTYQWGSKSATDYFCQNCGILPFRVPSYPTDDEMAAGSEIFTGYAVNTRCLDGFDPNDVRVHQIARRHVPIDDVIDSYEKNKERV